MQTTQARYVPQVDESACLAHGDCVDIAPSVFRLEGNVAEVIGVDTPYKILKAAEACPSVAIVVIDSASGEQVFP